MNVGDLAADAFTARLAGGGIAIEIAPFVTRIRAALPRVARALQLMYSAYPVDEAGFCDFHIELVAGEGMRRWFRPQTNFQLDGKRPFKPLPLEQAYPMFEWGLNWCIANHCHRFLMLHAAVLARDRQAVILPGPPGSGKSTLTAALASRGWRLLSDEMALIVPSTLDLVPVPRPISLKNQSIELIRRFAPDAVVGPVWPDTRKGDIAHVRASAESIARAHEFATPRWVVFPRYEAGADASLEYLSKARAVARLAGNAFNMSRLGGDGFDCIVEVADACECHLFRYSRLDDAVAAFDALPS